MTHPFSRPLRISMGIAAAKIMPGDVAMNLLRDEVHSTFLAMGVPVEKITACDDVIISNFMKIKNMPDKQAFDYMVERAKECLVKVGVEEKVVASIRFE